MTFYLFSLSAKEFILKTEKKDNKADDDRRRPMSRTFNNWLQAFFDFSGVLCEKFQKKSFRLFQRIDIILEASSKVGVKRCWLVAKYFSPSKILLF